MCTEKDFVKIFFLNVLSICLPQYVWVKKTLDAEETL